MRARQPQKIDWPPRQRLLTGDFSAIFDQGALAHLSLRAHELIRLVYVAIRDPSWNTVPTVPLSVHLCSEAGYFFVKVKARATGSSLDLEWELVARGSTDGSLEMNFRARALRDCAFARIGLCLHFDAERFKAAPWEAENLTNSCSAQFPSAIHPQFLVNGVLQPCIPAFSRMRITLGKLTSIALSLEGDQFEIEDQRNWTDATFKAYTTPLALGELHHLTTGETIEQKLHISCQAPTEPRPASQAVIQARALPPMERRHLPQLGAALPPISSCDQAIPSIQFSYWRVDIRTESDTEAIASYIKKFHGTQGVELVLHPDVVPDQKLDMLLSTVARCGSLMRVILLGGPESLPSPDKVLALKAKIKGISEELPVGAGAPGAYADIARDLNDFSEVDFVSFPISPQAHVFDNLSIFETLPIQEQVVRAAIQRTAGGKVIVSPLTFGLQAHSPQADSRLQGRDRRIDEIGAAWLGASLGRLAFGGANAVTLAPDLWMTPGPPTELTDLLQIYTGLGKVILQPFETDDPRRVFLFGAKKDNETTIFLINLTGDQQTLHLNGLIPKELKEPPKLNAKSSHVLPVVFSEKGAIVHLFPYQIRLLRHLHP